MVHIVNALDRASRLGGGIWNDGRLPLPSSQPSYCIQIHSNQDWSSSRASLGSNWPEKWRTPNPTGPKQSTDATSAAAPGRSRRTFGLFYLHRRVWSFPVSQTSIPILNTSLNTPISTCGSRCTGTTMIAPSKPDLNLPSPAIEILREEVQNANIRPFGS
ncbi:hypothetical protein BJ508DRAFT_170116 [Ascobolus immersus RN42]|uniref:Uncharacterized protein n=1 Tax=Ascobolus immersus RN42 TaxID=1160509 RepID=A0A3N4HUG2_ASCIM|nr:hypothetical protein BJ508DRAFT_170116 [Ascobolus immersus RN42]